MWRKWHTACLSAFVALCGLVCFAQAPATPAANPAAGNKLDLMFVPTDAVAISVLQPRQLFTGPQAGVLNYLLQAAGGKDKIGFDPRDIEQALVVMGANSNAAANSSGPPPFGFVIRYVKPIDQQALAAKIVPVGSEATIENRKARINSRLNEMSCAFADATTLLVSNEAGLHWLLAAKPGDSPLRKLASSADDTPDWQLLVAVKPIRSEVAAGMAEAVQHAPPQYATQLSSLPKIPTLADTLTAGLREGPHGSMQFDMSVASPNDAAAKELTADVKQLLDVGHSMFLDQINSAGAKIPPQIMNQFRTIADSVVAGLQPTQAADHVNFHADIKSGPAAIGVAVALILPAVQAAREVAARNTDANNLKRLGLALLNYEDVNKHLPAQAIYDKQGKPLLSWRVAILPQLEEEELYKQFHLDEPWDSEHNKALIEKMPDSFKHPKFDEPGKTVYQAVYGKGCAFEGTQGTKLSSFTDGTSNTALVVESTPENAVPWTKPEDWTPDEQDPRKNLGVLFAGDITNIVFTDGHVDGIAVKEIDPAILKAIFTRNGGEKIPR